MLPYAHSEQFRIIDTNSTSLAKVDMGCEFVDFLMEVGFLASSMAYRLIRKVPISSTRY